MFAFRFVSTRPFDYAQGDTLCGNGLGYVFGTLPRDERAALRLLNMTARGQRFREMFRRATLAQHDTAGCHSERSREISWKRVVYVLCSLPRDVSTALRLLNMTGEGASARCFGKLNMTGKRNVRLLPLFKKINYNF